jgi:predicted nucleic acid-binding protein
LIFLLDTNVLSAVMGSRPAREVATWMAQQPPDLLFTAAVCQAEILLGIAVLP